MSRAQRKTQLPQCEAQRKLRKGLPVFQRIRQVTVEQVAQKLLSGYIEG